MIAGGTVQWWWQRLPPPEHDPAEVDRRIDDILSRPEFQPPERTWLRRVWDGFVEWLRSLFNADDDVPEITEVPVESGGGGGPGALIAYLLLAAVLLLAAWVVWRLVRDRTPRAKSDTGGDPGVSIDIDEHRSAADWRERANELEADGRWKDAVRAWLRWGIAGLVDREVLEDVPGRTTGEYRRYVARHEPDLDADFDRATRLFDEVWYADRAADAESVATMRRHMEAVVDAAPRQGSAGVGDHAQPMAEIS